MVRTNPMCLMFGVVLSTAACAKHHVPAEREEEAPSAHAQVVFQVATQGLFRVPANGSVQAEQITPALPAGSRMASFAISADHSRLVYRVSLADGGEELFAVNLDGSGVVRLASHSGIIDFDIAPDSARVVYGADSKLFVVSLGGTGETQLTNAGGAFSISSDSSRVVYKASRSARDDELWAVNIDGSNRVRISPTLMPGWVIRDFAVSPDSSRVIYQISRHSDFGWHSVLVGQELLATQLDGSNTVEIVPSRTPDGQLIDLTNFELSTDSSRVVYRANSELFTAGLDGLAKRQLTPSIAGGGRLIEFAIAPDSSRVAYQFFGGLDDVKGLVVAELNDSDERRDTKITEGFITSGFAFSPDSSQVVYATNEHELFATDLLDLDAVRLSPTMAEGPIWSYMISPDSLCVVYTADKIADGVFLELFAANLDGTGHVNLGATLPGHPGIGSFVVF